MGINQDREKLKYLKNNNKERLKVMLRAKKIYNNCCRKCQTKIFKTVKRGVLFDPKIHLCKGCKEKNRDLIYID